MGGSFSAQMLSSTELPLSIKLSAKHVNPAYYKCAVNSSSLHVLLIK